MVWLQFILSAAAVIAAAIKLSAYGDAIAHHTRLGRMFIGALLVAGATSLPELLTMVNSIGQGHINLTAGDLFGSSMFNMLLLGVLDILFHQHRVLRRIALRHALTASLGTGLMGLAVFFVLARLNLRLGWVGVDSLVLMGGYIVGVWLLRNNPVSGIALDEPLEEGAKIPSLRRALAGFALSTVVLIIAAPWLVRSGSGIADIAGVGEGFVGIVLIAFVTSLPELVATVSAARLGAFDMAAGNLFGSNLFNMFVLGLADVVYVQGSFWGAIDPAFALAGLLGMLLTTLGLVGNLAQVERRVWIVEIDALLLVLTYLAGIYFLYLRGIGA